MAKGRVTPTQVVDHVTPFNRVPPRLKEQYRLDSSNLQPLCAACHDSDKARIENDAAGWRNIRPDWIAYLYHFTPASETKEYIDRALGCGD